MTLVGSFLGGQAIGAAGVEAAIAEFSTGQLGVAWSDPHAPPQRAKQAAMRAVRGAAFGIAVAALVIALAFTTRAAHVTREGVSVRALLTGLLLPGLVAVREELFFRGLVLRVLSTARREAQLVACGLASIAAALGATDSGINLAQIAVAGLSGVAFGAIWQRERGAWMAWGAHAAWLWAMQAGTTAFDIAGTTWAGGNAGLGGGYVAVPVVTIAAIAAIFWAFRRPEPVSSPPT
jgi:membrane protease YdiL (CAAX protease family)